jgi:hypothetical protein
MKYKRGSLSDTMRVAIIVSTKAQGKRYVFATAGGYYIDKNPPAFQSYYVVDKGKTTLIPLPETCRMNGNPGMEDNLRIYEVKP